MIKTTRLLFSFFNMGFLLNSLQTDKYHCFVDAKSFEELALKCSVYVDKTLFIKDFIQTNFLLPNANETAFVNSTVHVLRLTYPRKWGKTTNLKMLEDFLNIEVDGEGNPKNPNDTSAYRLFARGKWSSGASATLNIARETDFLEEGHLANHSVIYVSFGGVTGATYAEIVLGVKQAIAEAFKTHSYLLKVYDRQMQNESYSSAQKHIQLVRDQFQVYLSASASEASTLVAIKFLSEQLYKHFDKKVYVFIDDHDQPLRSVFLAGISEPKLVAAVSLFLTRVALCSFYHLCYYYRPNLAVEKALITGVLRVTPFPADAKSVDGMDYNQELGLLDEQFGSYFGFNEKEVKVVFDLCNINKQLGEDARKWYRGYTGVDIPEQNFVSKYLIPKFYKTEKRYLVDLYNPYDIEQFVSKQVVSSYWAHTGSVPFLAVFLKNKMVESLVISLLNGEKLEVDLFTEINSEELQQLTKLLGPAKSALPLSPYSGHETDLLFAFLLAEGYLTLQKNEDGHMKRVKLPNEEIALDMSTKLLQHYADVYSIPLDVQNRVVDGFRHFIDGNITVTFKESLDALILHFSNFTGRKKDVMHTALNTVVLTSRQVYEFESSIHLWNDKVSGPKDLDMHPSIMLTLEKLQLGVLMQLMYNVSEKELTRIENFATCFRKNKNVKNVRLLAINVCPNKSVVMTEVWKPNRRFF